MLWEERTRLLNFQNYYLSTHFRISSALKLIIYDRLWWSLSSTFFAFSSNSTNLKKVSVFLSNLNVFENKFDLELNIKHSRRWRHAKSRRLNEILNNTVTLSNSATRMIKSVYGFYFRHFWILNSRSVRSFSEVVSLYYNH